jgi:cobalt-zinc-cadmium efflux system protein
MHAHSHGHGGAHDHGRASDRRAIAIALGLIAAFMVGEVAAGIVAGSLALLADAGHMLTDAAALAAALVASRLATRPARGQWTFGFGRLRSLPRRRTGSCPCCSDQTSTRGAAADRSLRADAGIAVVALVGVAVNLAATIVLARATAPAQCRRVRHIATDSSVIGTAIAGALISHREPFDPIAGCSWAR